MIQFQLEEPPPAGEERVMMMGLKTDLMIKWATLSYMMINLTSLTLTLDLSLNI